MWIEILGELDEFYRPNAILAVSLHKVSGSGRLMVVMFLPRAEADPVPHRGPKLELVTKGKRGTHHTMARQVSRTLNVLQHKCKVKSLLYS
jgi:hypothetical protein